MREVIEEKRINSSDFVQNAASTFQSVIFAYADFLSLASDYYLNRFHSCSGVLAETAEGLFWYCMAVLIILFFPIINSSRLLL